MNQARALGASLADVPFSAIFASDLKRAHTTAQALHAAQNQVPPAPLTTSPLLREQHFGIAEGKAWILTQDGSKPLAELYAAGVFPIITKRGGKFPEGESLNDLGRRATQAIDELVMPKVWSAAKAGKKGVQIAVVSHGLCISELIPALLNKDANSPPRQDFRGLMNTAWTRVTVDIPGAKEGEPLEFSDDTPPLSVRVTHVNVHDHIDKIKRQQGGVGSAAHDPAQKDIRAFFGGGSVKDEVKAEEHSESNANDEVDINLED
ncbi:hypothetical protein HWV62_2685 [Athelia sp. TMB]|nr:hypothetical protein HWV62_42886 [Athelia sp. TMB]KAF7977787.1 hypothetical protein HWV62_2685 [Athelia sp. TMB]